MRRFTQGVFPPGQGATIGVDFMIKTVVVDNEKIKVSNYFGEITSAFPNQRLITNRVFFVSLLFQLQIWYEYGMDLHHFAFQ